MNSQVWERVCGVLVKKHTLSRPHQWYAVAAAALCALAQPSRMSLCIWLWRIVAVNLAGCYGNRSGESAEKQKCQRKAA